MILWYQKSLEGLLFRLTQNICQALVLYRISSNKRLASNKRYPLISAAPLGIVIEISASPLISAPPLNAALIRIVAIFY